MVEGRERVSAAVILIIFLIAAVFVYLILLPPPVAYRLVYGNFSNQTSPSQVQNQTLIPQSFYYPISSYLGGNPNAQNYSYTMGTFGVSYNVYNSTLSNSAPFELTSSIFGSSSYNIGFNGSSSDNYFIKLDIGKVSGSPRLKVSLNGVYFYTSIPISGENLILRVPRINNGKNVISVYNYLNGFAFSQSIDFSNVSITQMYSVSVEHSISTTIPTIGGLGNFYIQLTPIGQGNLSVDINNQNLIDMLSGNDTQMTVRMSPNIVNGAVSPSASPIVPAKFNTSFTVIGANSSYVLANVGIVYAALVIPPHSLTIPYIIPKTSGEYMLTFYLNSIIKQGSVSFYFYPSGQSFQIPFSNLTVGENVLILPISAISGQTSSGNYTGTLSVSSTGLMIPQYVDIKPTS